MKKYYRTLSKDKKLEIKKQFKKDYKNSELYTRLIRLYIYAAIGYISSIIIFLESLFYETNKMGSIIIAITLFIASTVFLVGNFIIRYNMYNKIALKNK